MQVVAGLQRPIEDGKQRDDLNFNEALGAVNAQLNDPTDVPSNVAQILSDPQCGITNMEVSSSFPPRTWSPLPVTTRVATGYAATAATATRIPSIP